MLTALQAFSALFAFAAAALWFFASVIPAPKKIETIIITDEGFEGELPDLFTSVAKQSKWNAWGAGCAAVSAVLQGLALGMQAIG